MGAHFGRDNHMVAILALLHPLANELLGGFVLTDLRLVIHVMPQGETN